MAYATTAQLSTYTGGTAPGDASRRHAPHSARIAGSPTLPAVVSALRDATCAQVEYWIAGDEEDDVIGPLNSMSVGDQNQTFNNGNNRVTPMYLAPRAARHLRLAGLLDGAVGSY